MALARRFRVIEVNEPSPSDAIEILTRVAKGLEKHYRLQISSQAIEQAVALSHRYINDRFLPDKAIDMLDEACSTVFYHGASKVSREKKIKQLHGYAWTW